ALQYASYAGRPLALHEEEPTLSKGGQMHEGAVSAELGFAGWPSIAESTMVERDLTLAAYEGQPLHLLHLSARESVEALERAQAAPDRGAARAHVGRARRRLRTPGAADRGRRAGEPRPARPLRDLARARGRLPLALDELVAPRRDAPGPRREDDRERRSGARM